MDPTPQQLDRVERKIEYLRLKHSRIFKLQRKYNIAMNLIADKAGLTREELDRRLDERQS